MPPVPKPPSDTKRRNRNLIIAIAAAAVVAAALIAASFALSGGDDEDAAATTEATTTSTEATTTPDTSTPAPVALVAGIPQDGPILGNPAAKVRLVQFEDLQCPICRTYTEDALPGIVNEYVKPGLVKLDFKGLTFLGPDSLKALKIAVAAGFQDKLWEVVGLFYENQGEENSGWVTDELIDQILAEVPGLDAAKVKADAGTAAVTDEITAWSKEAETLQVPGTPWFYIGIGDSPVYEIRPRQLIPSEFRPALDDALSGP